MKWIFKIFFLTISFSVLAQKKDIQFEHLSMRDGLSMNPVIAITQDQKGFLWFGTQDGLNKYNGYNFKVYKSDESDPKSISDNFITALEVDKDGRIWIGTLNGGINIYDYKTGEFERINSKNSNLNSNKVLAIKKDKQNYIWIGTDKGINVFDGEKLILGESKYKNFGKLKDKTILVINSDSKNNLWIGTTEGLYFLDKKTQLLSHLSSGPEIKNLSHNVVLSVYEDNQKNIWIGTLDGLNKFIPNEGFKKYYFKDVQKNVNDSSAYYVIKKNNYSIINNYGGNTIRSIMQDYSGNLWIGTDMELIILNPETENYVNFKKDLINPTGINDHFIRAMYRDRSDILWIGTLGNGINKTDLKSKKFKHYQKKLNNSESLPENYVRSIVEDNVGNFWIGTLIGGLTYFDSKTESFKHIPDNNRMDGKTPNDNNIWSLFFKDSILWVGTNNGLNKYDLKLKKFSYFTHDNKNNQSISENTIRSIFIDSKNNLWVGTEGGLNLFDKTTKGFSKYLHNPNDQKSLSDNSIWKITEDKRGNLWVATNNGLNKINLSSNSITKYFKITGDKKSLSNNGVRTLLIDKENQLWVGTQNGLNIYNEKLNNFKRITEKDGLPNSFIYSITQDRNGLIWVTTNKGVASINPKDYSIKIYDVYDGLQDYEFNTNAATLASNGEIYLGGPNGLNRFNPSALTSSSVNPLIVITELKINDEAYSGKQDINELNTLKLNYFENNIYFEFASLDYSNPIRNKYKYKLEGFDKDWINAENNRYAKYTNLDPGTYTIIIQGTNSDGKWSTHEKRIIIEISPPFYKTFWFIGLVIIFSILFIYLLVKWRMKALIKDKIKLEERVNDRTKQINEEKIKVELANKELEKLSLVASKTDNAVIIADAEGRIEWINEGFQRMHGISLDASFYYGKFLQETSSNPNLDAIFKQAITEKKSVSYESLNTNFERKIFVQSTLTPIYDNQGTLKKFVVIDTDISERKFNEEIIKEKNKNITDSINYAVRIQEAILPHEEQIKEILNECFVLYKPKDIVSGDFYFIESIFSNEKHQLAGFAVGDCTGHGVPGAFMSIIGYNYLKQSLHQKDINSPAQALDFVSKNIYEMLSSQNSKTIIRDGMDIAFCVIDYKTLKLNFAGANRPLIIISNNELLEIKGDSSPVGYQDQVKEFINHSIDIKINDMIYIFSDGYADQFGGVFGKKFKITQLKSLLLEIYNLPLTEQKNILNEQFESWRGENEQVDDICIMGVRVS